MEQYIIAFLIGLPIGSISFLLTRQIVRWYHRRCRQKLLKRKVATIDTVVASGVFSGYKGTPAPYLCGVCSALVGSIEAWVTHASTHPDVGEVLFFGNNEARKPMGVMLNPSHNSSPKV